MTPTIRRAASYLSSLVVLGVASAVQVQPVSLSPEGIGQVLIYPYYTARNGWTTLLSIVNNDSANGKAVKVRFLEGKNGASVASFNLFLASDDVWTGAVLAGSSANDAAKLVSNDKSCTWPILRSQGMVSETGGVVIPTIFEFSNRAYVADGDSVALQTIDRTREGYIEVIEMASIPYDGETSSALLKQISSFSSGNYQPPCNAITDEDLSKYSAQISPPSGGLSGSATLVNVVGGASAEYAPTVLNGFWLTPSTATLAPNMTASVSPLPNLSSGGNTTAHYFYDAKTYLSKFSRSIDAVSATLMSMELLGEHAYTRDGVIGTTWIVSMPTKKFYTQSIATTPFSGPWDRSVGMACDAVIFRSFDRNAVIPSVSDDFGTRPPSPPAPTLCYSTVAVSFGGVTAVGTDLLFGSTNAFGVMGAQNLGNDVATPGKEGGKTRLIPIFSAASLASSSGSVTTVDAITGQPATTFGPHTLYGLPMIGVAFSQSSFKTGNPQQNFASGFRLQSTRRITTP